MCTVSLFFTDKNSFVLTSNRDEATARQTAAPQIYTEGGVRMLYPKDLTAGGTWIGVSDQNTLVCLLNGGYIKHVKQQKYAKSRGVVVKELLSVPNPKHYLEQLDCTGIEPFTIICLHWSQTLESLEFVWDGNQTHLSILEKKAHIWSSATLYTDRMKKEREKWFKEGFPDATFDKHKILKFHQTTKPENATYGLILNRGNLKTCSITQVIKEQNVEMNYYDLLTGQVYESNFQTAVI